MGRLSKEKRFKAAFIAAVIIAAWVLALLIGSGTVSGTSLFGVCAFEQKHNMPCPFCGMTRAVSKFAAGDIIEAFRLQPAGALLAAATALAMIYFTCRAIGFELVKINSYLKRIKPLPAVIIIIAVILIGWAISVYKYSRL